MLTFSVVSPKVRASRLSGPLRGLESRADVHWARPEQGNLYRVLERVVQQRMSKRIWACETYPVHVKKGPVLIGLVESMDFEL